MRILAISMLAFLLAGCWTNVTNARPVKERKFEKWDFEKFMKKDEKDVAKITVSHVLISFKETPRSTATRSKEEAKALALELYDRAQKGEDFESLVQEYSDDLGKQPYTMVMRPAKKGPDEYNRRAPDGMVPAFGDVGWRLEVGEIGMSDYDETDSPFGYHIILRTQ